MPTPRRTGQYLASMTTPKILTPYEFPRTGTQVRNRTVLAAMTNKQSHADGSLGDDELEWLAARARGGFGIVTTCAAHVSPDGQGWDGELGVFDDALLPGLSRLAGALRADGALSLVQIFHGGVRAPSRLTGQQPFSASAFELDAKDFEVPREATVDDIERTIAALRRRRPPLRRRRVRRRRDPRRPRLPHHPVPRDDLQRSRRRVGRLPREPRPLRQASRGRRA